MGVHSPHEEGSVITTIIFDMDGVISDTQRLYAEIEAALLRGHGIEVAPADITRRFAGVSGHVFFPQMFREAGRTLDDATPLIEERRRIILGRLREHVPPVPGSVDLIRALRGRGLRLAVGSASSHAVIGVVLDGLGVRDEFQAIASSHDVEPGRGKPEPDIFLLAASRVGAAPSECTVIEDGVSGMVAARRAGMRSIGYVPEGAFSDFPADRHVRRLSDVLAVLDELN